VKILPPLYDDAGNYIKKKELPDRVHVHLMDGHPENCPQCKKSAFNKEASPMKSGFKKGAGQWKRFCSVCGFVFYDLLKPRK